MISCNMKWSKSTVWNDCGRHLGWQVFTQSYRKTTYMLPKYPFTFQAMMNSVLCTIYTMMISKTCLHLTVSIFKFTTLTAHNNEMARTFWKKSSSWHWKCFMSLLSSYFFKVKENEKFWTVCSFISHLAENGVSLIVFVLWANKELILPLLFPFLPLPQSSPPPLA